MTISTKITKSRLAVAPGAPATLHVVFGAAGLMLGVLAASESTRSLAVLGATALAYLALFIWQPAVALLGYIALRPLVDAFVFQGFRGLTLGVIWGFGVIASASLFLLLESTDRGHKLRVAVVPAAFLFFLAALTLTRPEFVTAVSGWTRVASWILVMLACERIGRNRKGQLMCWWAGIGMGATLVVSVGIMIAQNRYGSAFYSDIGRGISGNLPHPSSIGAVLLLPFALSGALFVKRRALSLAITAGLLAAIILSYVRTALIGGLVVLGALLAVTARGSGKARFLGLSVAVGVGMTVYALRDRIGERFADLTLLSASGTARAGAGSGRLGAWRAALDGAFDSVQHAIIGRGAGASEQVMAKFLGVDVGAQNDFFDFLLAGGLILGICYLVLVAWMAASPLRIVRDSTQSSNARGFATLTLGAVAAFFVMSMLNGIATYQPAVAAGLLVGLCRGMATTPGETFLDGDELPVTDHAPGRA